MSFSGTHFIRRFNNSIVEREKVGDYQQAWETYGFAAPSSSTSSRARESVVEFLVILYICIIMCFASYDVYTDIVHGLALVANRNPIYNAILVIFLNPAV